MKIVIEGRLADHPQIGDDGQVQVFHPEDTLTFESADPDGPETEGSMIGHLQGQTAFEVRLLSWSRTSDHAAMDRLRGKLVRITIEAMDPAERQNG